MLNLLIWVDPNRNYIRHMWNATSKPGLSLAASGKSLVYPRVRRFLSVTDFWVVPEAKFSLGNFHGYVKKPKGLTRDSSRGKKLA